MRRDVRWNGANVREVVGSEWSGWNAVGVVRFVAAAFGWHLWIRLSLLAAATVLGAGLDLLGPTDLEGNLALVATPVVHITTGIAFGMLGAMIASRLRADWPTWWAPSVCAAAAVVALDSIGDSSAVISSLLKGVLAVMPILAGRALKVRAYPSETRAASTVDVV